MRHIRMPVVRPPLFAVAVAAMLATAACSGLNTSEQRMLSGGAIGAAGGAVIGAMAGGNPLAGAVIGGAAGTAGGYLYDRSKR